MLPFLLRNIHLYCLRGKSSFNFLQLIVISKCTPQHFIYHNYLSQGSITVFHQENRIINSLSLYSLESSYCKCGCPAGMSQNICQCLCILYISLFIIPGVAVLHVNHILDSIYYNKNY